MVTSANLIFKCGLNKENCPKMISIWGSSLEFALFGKAYQQRWKGLNIWFQWILVYLSSKKKTRKHIPPMGKFGNSLISSTSAVLVSLTRWWFQTFFIFTLTWGNDPIWRAYFSNGLVQPPTSLVSPGICDPFQEGRSEYHNFPVTTHSLHSPHGTKIQRSNELVWLLPWLIGGQWLGPVIHGCLSCILWILVVSKFKTIMYRLYMF